MPAPSATTVPARHQWALQFDRVTCRDCGAFFTDQGTDEHCAGAAKIRPMAGIRQQQEGGA